MPDGTSGTSAPDREPGAGSEVRAWLEPRFRSVPTDLAAAVRAAVDRELEAGEATSTEGEDPAGSAGPVAGVLARAALRELDRVTEMEGREAALALLAADAALTYSFEAALDDGGSPTDLAAAVGLRGALGRRLDAAGGATGA